MKPNKVIAVDTSLGTKFLISACDDATVCELRGLIQMGHLSCFPEHGSINVLALTVQYKQRQYHVTDSLLIGQICRKSWSNIHAEVSSGSVRAASASHSSQSAEAESLANGKAGNGCAALDDTLVSKCTGSKGLDVDRQSNEALAHSSSPLLCVEKALKVSCNEMIPIVSNSQTFWLDHRCPLLSMEAPYTQPHSQLNLSTRAALSKEVSGKGRQCKKQKCAEEEEVMGRKQNQVYNFDEDEDSSPGKKSAINIKGEINSQDPKGFLPKGQQVAPIKGDAQLGDALKEPPQAPMTGEAQVAEAHKELKTNESQCVNTDDSILRIQSKSPLCPHSEALVASPAISKPTSSLSERDFAALEKEATNEAPYTARIEGLSCPKLSTENQAEGMEDANLNNGAQVSKVDMSMGYPIQLNDHTILFVASLSADVVPETQESQMQSQDGMNAEGEEVALAKTGIDVYEYAASMEPHSIGAQGLPPHQDARNMNPMDAHNDEEHLAFLAEKKETSNQKLSVVADAEKEDIGTLGAHTIKLDIQLHDTGLSGGNHDIPLVQKKKKRKRKKVFEIHKVSVQEDSRFIASGRGIPGDMEPKKDAAHLLKNQTEMYNHDKGGEIVHMLEGQAEIVSGNVDALNIDDADLKELERQNGTTLSVDQGNLRESPCFAGEKSSGENLIEDSLKGENCEAAMQGEMLSMKEGQVTHGGTTRRKKKRKNGTALSVEQGNHRESPCFAGEKRSKEKLIEGSLKGENCDTMQGEMLGMNEGEVTQAGITRRKKKRRRKAPSPEGNLGNNPLNMGNEGVGVPFTIKELPNVLRLTAVKEGGELYCSSTAKVVGEQVSKEGKERETLESDPNISLMQEQDQDHATIDHANRKALLKDRQLVAPSSTSSHSKQCSKEGPLVKTQRGFDVFDFESSETGNRVKENCTNNDVTSISEANNLEKLCAAAVKLVEDEILSSSKSTTRKSSRKAVHPKRWITVLTERLTWNQTSKSNLKKQRANKRSKTIPEGASLPNNEGLKTEPLYVEEEEAKEERSQVILGDGRVACPNGCGKLYTKKTSAYYRHCRQCSGGDYGCMS